MENVSVPGGTGRAADGYDVMDQWKKPLLADTYCPQFHLTSISLLFVGAGIGSMAKHHVRARMGGGGSIGL